MRKLWAMGILGTLVLATPALALAQKKDKKTGAGGAGGMDEKAMMEAWMKASTPGEPHQQLAKQVGSWTTAVKFWMAPNAPAQESTGSSDMKSILGGRFIEENSKGTFMGQPFEGVGIFGYDNIKKKYTMVWVDNMGTMMETAEGTMADKTLTMNGEAIDPMTGKKAKHRSVLHFDSDKKYTMEMFGPDPKGKEFKMMEIVYTKK
jgi:hypothetical protein